MKQAFNNILVSCANMATPTPVELVNKESTTENQRILADIRLIEFFHKDRQSEEVLAHYRDEISISELDEHGYLSTINHKRFLVIVREKILAHNPEALSADIRVTKVSLSFLLPLSVPNTEGKLEHFPGSTEFVVLLEPKAHQYRQGLTNKRSMKKSLYHYHLLEVSRQGQQQFSYKVEYRESQWKKSRDVQRRYDEENRAFIELSSCSSHDPTANMSEHHNTIPVQNNESSSQHVDTERIDVTNPLSSPERVKVRPASKDDTSFEQTKKLKSNLLEQTIMRHTDPTAAQVPDIRQARNGYNDDTNPEHTGNSVRSYPSDGGNSRLQLNLLNLQGAHFLATNVNMSHRSRTGCGDLQINRDEDIYDD
jgi:hypothetical protein